MSKKQSAQLKEGKTNGRGKQKSLPVPDHFKRAASEVGFRINTVGKTCKGCVYVTGSFPNGEKANFPAKGKYPQIREMLAQYIPSN
jgi:hypothetical protein